MNISHLKNITIIFLTIFVFSFVALAQFNPVIVVRNQDNLLIDNNGDQLADPNDVIQYSVIIGNCGDGTAENVVYSAQADPNVQVEINSILTGGLETVDPSLCPQTSNNSENNEDNNSDDTPTSPPVILDADAVDDTISVTVGSTANENIITNDIGDAPLTVVSFGDSLANVGTVPADGVTILSIPAGAGTIDITIDANGNAIVDASTATGSGTITIFYQLQASNATTDTAQITITFGDFPTTVDDTLATLGAGNEYTTDVNVDLNIPAGTGLLNNDTLGNPAGTLTLWGGSDASATVTLNPASSTPLAGGTLTVNADGSFDLVTPTVAGTYTFAYILDNGLGTSQASVEIYVAEVPTAVDDSLDGSVNTTNNYATLALFNDNGSGADNLGAPSATITAWGNIDGVSGNATEFAVPSTQNLPVALGGTLTVNADGSFVVDTPTATGTFTFQYQLENSSGTSLGTVTINIVSVPMTQNDALEVVLGNNLSGDVTADNGSGADTSGVPAFTTLTFGDGDLGGTVTSNNGGASVALAGGTVSLSNTGAITLNGATTAGTYTFDYQLTNTNGTSNSSTVTITVQEAPTANNDALTASTNIANTYTAPALFNDNSSGADDLGTPVATIASFGGGDTVGGTDASDVVANGTNSATLAGGILVVGTDGSFSLNNPTATGTFTFDYRLTNVAGSSDATVTITINAVPDAVSDPNGGLSTTSTPINDGVANVNDNPYHTALNTTLSISVGNGLLGNDDLGSPVGTISGFDTTSTQGGTVNVAGDGSVTYTPPSATFMGADSFNYTLSNSAGSNTTNVALAVGLRPACVADNYTATGNIGIDTTNGTNQDVLFNDTGSSIAVTTIVGSGDVVAPFVGVSANNGTVTMQANGHFVYNPPAGFTGNDTFSYQITNGFGDVTTNCDVTITISDMVYFMDSSASAGGNGTLARPFQTIAEHNATTIPTNSRLFIKDNGIDYTGNLVLASGQRVIGEGTTGTLFGGVSLTGITLAPLSVTMPYSTNGTATSWAQIINPVGDGITLNINNNLSGLSIGNTSGTGLIGTSINTLTVTEMEIIGTGNVMNLDMGTTLDITFTTLSTTNASGNAIFVSGFGGSFTATTTNLTGVIGHGINIINSSGTVNLGTTTVNSVGNSAWLQNANASASFTINNVGGLTTTNGTALSASNYDGQMTVTGIGGLTGVSACIQIVGNPSTTINVDVENCIASASSAYGLRLTNVTGTGLIVRNATNITQTGGISPAIQIFNSSATLIDISDNSTITITNRRNRGIEVDMVSSTVNFGTTTVNNPNLSTEPAIYLTDVTAAIDFDSLSANQGGIGTGETYTVNVPNNNDGLGDVVYADNVTNLTLNGGTLSNTGDDGIDFRNSGALTLNNVSIRFINGSNRSNGIQAYNSDSVTMTGGSINDFTGTGVTSGGAEPWGAYIYHDNTYTGASSTSIFDSVDFNGGTGTNGNGIVLLNEDNTVSNLIVRNGSSFINTDELSIWSVINGSGTVSTTVTDSTFNTPLAGGNTGINISDGTASTGTAEFNINNNIFDDIGDNTGGAVLITLLDGTNARTQTNQINNNMMTETDGSPAQTGIFIFIAETSGLNLEANNNIITGFSEYALLLSTGGWTSGEIDLSMSNNTLSTIGTEPAFEVSDAGNIGSMGNIQILFDDVNISAPNGIAAEVETSSSRIDWVTTNSIFSASITPNILVDVQDIGTICVDFNDDGGGQNTTTNGFILLETSGTLLLENGTTAGDVIADNPGMNNGVPTVVGASQADCNNATP